MNNFHSLKEEKEDRFGILGISNTGGIKGVYSADIDAGTVALLGNTLIFRRPFESVSESGEFITFLLKEGIPLSEIEIIGNIGNKTCNSIRIKGDKNLKKIKEIFEKTLIPTGKNNGENWLPLKLIEITQYQVEKILSGRKQGTKEVA